MQPPETSADEVQRFVAVTVADLHHVVRVEAVGEILRMVSTEPLPEADPSVLGIIDLRGAIVPVIDLRRRFGLPETPPAPQDRIVITRSSSGLAGLRVDAVTQLAVVPADEIEQLDVDGAGAGRLARAAVRIDGQLHYEIDLDAVCAVAKPEVIA